MHIGDTLSNRDKIRQQVRPSRPWTSEQLKELDQWTHNLGYPLVLRFGSSVWLNLEGKPQVTAIVSCGIVSEFLLISCSVEDTQGHTSPMVCLRRGLALSDAALWCAEVASDFEEASILAGIPVKNGSGFVGSTSAMIRNHLVPTLPVSR